MKLVVTGNKDLFSELKENNNDVEWIYVNDINENISDHVDGYFDLNDNHHNTIFPSGKPVFINSVAITLEELNTNANVFRINGWKGFLRRDSWEVAGKQNNEAASIINRMGKKIIWLPDEPGFIAARIIAMIVNEAWFAKGDEVSSNDEIDIAMKLGTNYPKGPFEWSDEIGEKNIYLLLKKLAQKDSRYIPAPLFKQTVG